MDKHQQAVDYFKRSIAIDPDNPDSHYFLGITYFRLEEYREGREQLIQALALAPQYKDAQDALQRAKHLRKQEGWEIEQIDLAVCLEKKKEYHQALCVWKELFAAHPEDPYYSFSLGHVLSRMNRYRQAELFFNRTLAIDPEYHDGLLRMGLLQLAWGRAACAEAWFLRLLALEPGHSDALDGLARAQYILNRFCEAKQTVLERAAIGPLDYQMWKLDHRVLLETNVWLKDEVIYSQEREDDLITKLTTAQRNTFVNVLSGSTPTCHQWFHFTGTFLAGTEREINLINNTNNLFVKFGLVGLGATYLPKPNWKMAASFNVKYGNNVGVTNFDLGHRVRIEPAGSLSYVAPDRNYGISATVDSLLVKLFGSSRSTFIQRDTYLGFVQHQLFNRRITAQISGFYTYYHSSPLNRQWEGEGWVEHGFPRFSPLIFVRYTGRIGGFETNEADYYSYKRQWEHFAGVYFSRYTALNLEMELCYRHSWQWSRDLSQPINTAIFVDRLFRGTDKLIFEMRQLYRPNIRGVFHTEYYWDSTNYKAWNVKGSLTAVF